MRKALAISALALLTGCTSPTARTTPVTGFERLSQLYSNSCPTPRITYLDSELVIDLGKTIISAYDLDNNQDFETLKILRNREPTLTYQQNEGGNFSVPEKFSQYGSQSHLQELAENARK